MRIALHAGVTDSKSAIRMMSMLEKVCIKKENVGKRKQASGSRKRNLAQSSSELKRLLQY